MGGGAWAGADGPRLLAGWGSGRLSGLLLTPGSLLLSGLPKPGGNKDGLLRAGGRAYVLGC